MVNAPALRLGLFSCPLCHNRNKGYTDIPPVPILRVFTAGKILSAYLVPIAP